MTIVTYGATYINGSAIPFNTPSKRGNETHKKTIRHKDIIMIGGRSIRFEYPAGHPMTHRRRSSRKDFNFFVKLLLEYVVYRCTRMSILTDIETLKSGSSVRKQPGTPSKSPARARDSIAVARMHGTPNSAIKKRTSVGLADIGIGGGRRRVTFGVALR